MTLQKTEMKLPGSPDINRRDFMKRLLSASLAIGAVAASGAALYDPLGPKASNDEHSAPQFASYALPDLSGDKARLAIVQGPDRAASLLKAMEALGGIGVFIKTGDRVLIKVNAAFASPASLGATTNPKLLETMAGLCLKAGASQVLVTDNPINDPASCFRLSGLEEAAKISGARLILPQTKHFSRFSLTGGRLIKDWPVLLGPFQGVNKVISAAPLKDHHRAGASMILKNWYGLLGGQRNVFHQDINGLITELALMIKPTLVVLDGVTAMMTNGPTGGSMSDLKASNTLIVSTDQVAADAVGSEILGRKPSDIPYIVQAQAAGAGAADYEKLKPIRINL